MRRAPALVAAASLLLLTLAGCASSSSSATSCSSQAQPGSQSQLIHVHGRFGVKPTVSFPDPMHTTTTEASTVIRGSGTKLQKDQAALIDFQIYNGQNGRLVESSKYSLAQSTSVTVGKSLAGLDKALQCATVGSRLAIAIAPKDGLGANGAQAGISSKSTLVMVVDVRKAFLPKANGAVRPAQPGFPTVVLAPNGRPGIKINTSTPPSTLQVETLKQGSGATVKRGDSIVVQYTGVLFKEKTVFDSSWPKQPITLVAADGTTTQGGVIPGFADAVIGKRVGSQVVVIIPPKLAYGSQGNSSVPANSTLVFVIDILGIS